MISRCLLCGAEPVAVMVHAIPGTDATYDAVMRLRETPVPDGHTPTLRYGLCQFHARDMRRSGQQVEARILAAAAEVSIQ